MEKEIYSKKKLDKKNINTLFKNKVRGIIFCLAICLFAVFPVFSDPSNTTNDIKIYWTDFETLKFEIQVEDGSEHILEIHFQVNGDNLFILVQDDDSYNTSLSYQNVDDMRQDWDGYVNLSFGTFNWGTINNGDDDQWVTLEWKPNYSSSQAIQISTSAEISGGGTDNDWSLTNWPGGDGGKKYFIKSIPSPEEFVTSFTGDQNGKCDWATPSDITNIIAKNSELTKKEIWIDRDGSNAAKIDYAQTSWTDDQLGNSYNGYYHFEIGGASMESGESGGETPEIKEVSTPAGLTATKNNCDGSILVTWDYNGDVEPTEFILKAGGATIATLNGDIREYTHSGVGNYTTVEYQITANGSYNGVESSKTSSTAEGGTSGPPSQPSSFSASRSGNNVHLSWSSSSHQNKYVIVRNSSSGTAEFEVSESSTSYTDNTVTGCETYKYELYAANTCTEDAGLKGIKASSTPSIRLQPTLSSYLTSVDASKAYYPDKVIVEWIVQDDNLSLVDEFVVQRRIAGSSSWTTIGTVQGLSVFEDKTAIGGTIYEYQVKANLNCEDDVLSSNQLQTMGFRIPYAIVTGDIKYENGTAVKEAEVLAEKGSAPIGTSLHFDGNDYVTISNESKLNPSTFIAVEAWVRPESVSGTQTIIDKYSGSGYELYLENNDVVFQVNIAGSTNTVRAQNVLDLNQYVHLAGVYDSTGVKIFVNGVVPTDVTYELTSDNATYLSDVGVAPEVIAQLSGVIDNEYTSYEDFQSDMIAAIDTPLTQSLMPIIIPLARIEEYQPGIVLEGVTGTISHNSSSLSIGNNFQGNIDEIRIWSNARDEETVKYDYKRVVGNDAKGIAAYWRCDENFGSYIYDASKSNGEFHKNNGTFSGTTWSTTIPNKNLLGWMGKADANGFYTIPYIPYFGTGENFTLTPRYEQHEFDPGSKTVFLGEGAAILDEQNFTDISSFKLTGTVFYENTYCGVEGAIVGIDGSPVVKNNNLVYTDENGEFEIAMPVGEHYVYVVKAGHVYQSYKFPPGPEEATFNFQEDMVGINFIDQTTQKIVGRVVGGTEQGDKEPGLGLSTNNVGIAEFDLISVTGFGCSQFHVRTDSITGEYELEVPPMKYNIRNFVVPKNPAVGLYFTELEIADFSTVEDDTEVIYEYPNKSKASIAMYRSEEVVQISVETEKKVYELPLTIVNPGADNMRGRFEFVDEIYEFKLSQDENLTTVTDTVTTEPRYDTTYYNYRRDFIYRSAPTLSVSDVDGESPFSGDKSYNYEDPVSGKLKAFDLVTNPFQYPVFTQGKEYQMLVKLEEVYYNQDMCDGVNGCPEAVEDRVAVNDGALEIQNAMAMVKTPEPVEISNGEAVYTFTGGYPVLTSDANFPWRSFSGSINITAVLHGNGYTWEPYNTASAATMPFQYNDANFPHPDDKYFRGYLLGNKTINGSDFATSGPEVVKYILRDPPGSESFSYLEKGTSISNSYTMNVGGGVTVDENLNVDMGMEEMIVPPLGGPVIQNEVINDLDIGLEASTSADTEKGWEETLTTTQTWSTSNAPELAGSASDLFLGNSQNFTISIADNLTILPLEYAADTLGLPIAGNPAGTSGNQFTVCKKKQLCADPKSFDTWFVYTADHIENYLIPNLINLRNNLFVSDQRYSSNVPANHDLFGVNNDNPEWYLYGDVPSTNSPFSTQPEDYDGPSYTFTPQGDDDKDEIRKYNEQIRLWQEALERNEREKYNAELVRNISYNAGSEIEYSDEVETMKYTTTTFELDIDQTVTHEFGFEFKGVGMTNSLSRTISFNYGNSKGSTQTETTTYGYVFSDPDMGDYFSVDVKDPKTGTGPVFATKAGRSMCPYEDEVALKYYLPGKYTITDSVLLELHNLGMSDDLYDILAWRNTDKFDLSEIYIDYGISDELMAEISDFSVKLEQIREREFTNDIKLTETVLKHIDLSLEDKYKEDIDDLSSDYEEIANHLDTENSKQKFFLFSIDKRDSLKSEYYLYLSHILDQSVKVDSNRIGKINLGEATIRREIPVASVSPAVQYNVPDDNKAYFTAQFGNNSASGDAMWYEARVLEESNPDGAVILIDGLSVNRTYEINASEFINKTISVEMGKPDVYDYENLQIALYSPCEWDFHTNGMSMPAEAIDTITFSVHFVPSCTDVDVVMPNDMFVINGKDEHLVEGVKETKVPIMMSGYDLNNSIFDKVTFQYKFSAEPEWTSTTPFYVNPGDDELEIPGAFTALEWNLSGYPDGEYMMRAKTGCGTSPDGTEIFDLSEVWTGTVDRKPPKVFGSPQPADGILSPDDDIIIEFNETIFGEKLSKIENFDIRGILNGTEIRHDVSVKFDNDASQYVRIPDGINLSDKSFTVEFWMKPARAMHNECLFAQSTDPNDAVYIGLTNTGALELQVANQTVEFDSYSVSDYLETWNHYAFVYDNVRKEAILMVNGIPQTSEPINASYGGFGDIYIGKSMFGNENPFRGNIHELRIWERARTAGKVYENMLVTLSGKETALLGYWPLDDADGTLATDKVHKRNASVTGLWEILPAGYACSLTGSTDGLINVPFSDIAFTPEQNFTIEMWFKGTDGANKCLLSNGHGDEDDVTLYYISLESLDKIVRVMPLEDSIDMKLAPMLNRIFSSQSDFLNEVGIYIGLDKASQYEEQILRFAKILPTYWSINTNSDGYLQVSNNGKRVVVPENYFDNTWHHLALVVERVGNTRIFVDGELKLSEPSTEWSGFGGARLFIGARGLYDINSASFTFDQYFDGEIDEVRIWSTVLKQTQVQRNRKMRLDGDELGLVAYWPFESYEEVMGVPIISGIFDDVISDRAETVGATLFTQNTEVPNVRMKRPSSKVDFSFVYKEDQIAFVINEPIAKIENCILDITVQNVQDMYGNKMSSPATWSAYVDMNQVKWNKQQIDLEKEIYAPLSFTAKVVNSSGLQQNFSVENLPGWLTASPSVGTLEPLTEQEIVFTVDEGTNVGQYSQNIHLQTDFDFDEKLMVNLRVTKALPPDWEINPGDFEHSMNIIGMVTINNVISTDKYDKVAAFVNGECRGIANLKYIPEYDMYEAFIDIYSNNVAGEYFELHVWDASDGREFRKVQADGLREAPVQYDGLYEFVDNTIHGSPSTPVNFMANNTIIQKIPMTAGWNWKSFNLTMDRNKPLTYQLEGLDSERGDMVKGLTKYSEFSSYWIGTLNYLEPENMYMFKVSKADTLKVSGIPVNPLTTPVEIVQGWNWIGYTPQVNISINDALGKFTPNHGDLLKSQFAFAMYDELMGWVGTLTFLKPNEGYKYKYIPQGDAPLLQQLFYPEEGTVLKSAKLYGEDEETPSIPSYSKFQDNMPLIAIIDIPAGKQSMKDELLVYSNDELRGKSSPISLEGGRLMYFVSIYGNQAADTLTLQFKNEKGQIVDVHETLNYSSSEILGSTSNPVILTVDSDGLFSTDETISYNIYPNPFNTQLQFKLSLQKAEQVEIEILNVIGKSVSDKVKLNGSEINTIINTSDLKSGVYMVKLSIGDSVFYEKLIKE